MNLRFSLFVFLFPIILSGHAQENTFVYESKTLKIEQLTESTYRHISYLSTESYGKVACNGMVVIDSDEALVFDTPVDDSSSMELITAIKNVMNCEVVGVVVTHFHEDCLGGLKEFHEQQVPSYASSKTIELAKSDSAEIPQTGFENSLELKVGSKLVLNAFLGEGHTKDNIVSYFPDERVLFGGCLVKSIGAGKGYLGDANTSEWSNTVRAVKAQFKKAKVVVPGHGKPGNTDLLDYTIKLFEVE